MSETKRLSHGSVQIGLVGGIALLAVAGWLYIDRQSFLETAVETEGTVVGTRHHRGNDSRSYRAVFKFRDAAGVEHKITSRLSTNVRWHRYGDSVPVLYDPDNPKKAMIGTFYQIWGIPCVLAIAGVLGVVGGLFVPPETLKRLRGQSSDGVSTSEDPRHGGRPGMPGGRVPGVRRPL